MKMHTPMVGKIKRVRKHVRKHIKRQAGKVRHAFKLVGDVLISWNKHLDWKLAVADDLLAKSAQAMVRDPQSLIRVRVINGIDDSQVGYVLTLVLTGKKWLDGVYGYCIHVIAKVQDWAIRKGKARICTRRSELDMIIPIPPTTIQFST